jgi:hypothetical protein
MSDSSSDEGGDAPALLQRGSSAASNTNDNRNNNNNDSENDSDANDDEDASADEASDSDQSDASLEVCFLHAFWFNNQVIHTAAKSQHCCT